MKYVFVYESVTILVRLGKIIRKVNNPQIEDSLDNRCKKGKKTERVRPETPNLLSALDVK